MSARPARRVAMATIDRVRRYYAPTLELAGIVANDYRAQTTEARTRLEELRDTYGELVRDVCPHIEVVTKAGGAAAPVSAYGAEGAAHRAVLAAGGQTIAVLPSGLDRPYPAAHSDLLRQAGDACLSVTELPSGAAPTEHRFTARNRLMAALSGATVIPGAGVRSGPITTVLAARDLGRDVGAVPGPVTSAASSGPNELIRQGFAVLITQPSDVTALLDADVVPGKAVVRPVIGWELTNRGPSRGTPGPTL